MKTIKKDNNIDHVIHDNDNIYKRLRVKSLIGLTIFIVSIISAYFYLNHAILGFFSIIGMIIGWFIFSKNHTEITSLKIKAITEEYLKEKFKSSN